MESSQRSVVKRMLLMLALVPIAVLASPGSGILFNVVVSQGVTTSGIRDTGNFGSWQSVLVTNGPTLLRTQNFAIAPGGYGGWHSHPGPVLVTVRRGTVTWYDSKCQPTPYPAGSAYLEPAGEVHNPRNEGSEDAEAFGTLIVPVGVATRIEATPPAACPNLP